MKNLNIYALMLSILGALSGYLGCVRPDPTVPENYAVYPLEAKGTELPDGSFRLTWNAIKSADFIEYQVIKNTGDTVPFIADSAINKLVRINPNLELAKKIADVDSTFFVDSFSVPTNRTFLRVFAVLKNRNLSSKNVAMPIKSDAQELALTVSDALYIPEEKKIALADKTTNKLAIYDIPSNKLTLNASFVNLTSSAEMTYGRLNNMTEFLIPLGTFGSSISVINLSGIFVGSFFSNGVSNSLDAILYEKTSDSYLTMSAQPATIRSFLRPFPLNNGSGVALVTSTAFFPATRLQTAYVFRKAPNAREAIAVSITNGSSDLIWFRYDADCKNVTKINGLSTISLNITKRPFAIAPDNQRFITGPKGLIFNRGMSLVDSLKLPTSDALYADMVYSNDGTRLYAVRNATDRSGKFVDIYAYPSFKFERSVAFKSTPTRIFQDGDYLILVGRSPNNARLAMVEKVKL